MHVGVCKRHVHYVQCALSRVKSQYMILDAGEMVLVGGRKYEYKEDNTFNQTQTFQFISFSAINITFSPLQSPALPPGWFRLVLCSAPSVSQSFSQSRRRPLSYCHEGRAPIRHYVQPNCPL